MRVKVGARRTSLQFQSRQDAFIDGSASDEVAWSRARGHPAGHEEKIFLK